ncbi:hypothetical protein Pcinc_034059 [Petrolisthes cinctipes]|uniref:Uncharacterized protein n=1 Tax=Petrolisthes cinctipes TaxID=88211 RepID=A0AAE1JY23_PETCI|nr:hypothetical protein Pcinc_034059 [Petrolisthes cinctipes]
MLIFSLPHRTRVHLSLLPHLLPLMFSLLTRFPLSFSPHIIFPTFSPLVALSSPLVTLSCSHIPLSSSSRPVHHSPPPPPTTLHTYPSSSSTVNSPRIKGHKSGHIATHLKESENQASYCRQGIGGWLSHAPHITYIHAL